MTKKKMIIISFIIALIFDFPFKWIQYKGEQMVSLFDVYHLGMKNMFFDFSLLFISTFIIFLIWNWILKNNNIRSHTKNVPK